MTIQKPDRNMTRIQREKTEAILAAALVVFSDHGFRGSTVDQIATEAGISKPNLLYYFESKGAIHTALLGRHLDAWLDPLRQIDEDGNGPEEIARYIRRKLEMSRDFPRESRLFANEILQGGPRILPEISGTLKDLVDTVANTIRKWSREGQIAEVDPYHLIFSIWATTQHYADFDVQIRAIIGTGDADHFATAETFLTKLYRTGLSPQA